MRLMRVLNNVEFSYISLCNKMSIDNRNCYGRHGEAQRVHAFVCSMSVVESFLEVVSVMYLTKISFWGH
jgi:hypothetical protein